MIDHNFVPYTGAMVDGTCMMCNAEGCTSNNGGTAAQDDEDFGDGGYHEAFKEYCLYARKR